MQEAQYKTQLGNYEKNPTHDEAINLIISNISIDGKGSIELVYQANLDHIMRQEPNADVNSRLMKAELMLCDTLNELSKKLEFGTYTPRELTTIKTNVTAAAMECYAIKESITLYNEELAKAYNNLLYPGANEVTAFLTSLDDIAKFAKKYKKNKVHLGEGMENITEFVLCTSDFNTMVKITLHAKRMSEGKYTSTESLLLLINKIFFGYDLTGISQQQRIAKDIYNKIERNGDPISEP